MSSYLFFQEIDFKLITEKEEILKYLNYGNF